MQVTLDILVEALGRVNFGCVWDYKGLTSPEIKLNGEYFCAALSWLLECLAALSHARQTNPTLPQSMTVTVTRPLLV